jgi:hypothetical protein
MDGVGDYTRLLALEVVAQGHSCYLLSVADSHVAQVSAGEFGALGGLVPYLRLPAGEPWAERVRVAKAFAKQVAPDWISWQIVPYGFDARGLSFGLGRRFAGIAGNCKNQVMFHEIWIGEAVGSSLKNRFVGAMQKYIIKDLLQKLRPSVVQTHTPLYQFLLGKIGFPARILPLFGNIPLTGQTHPDWLKNRWPGIDLVDRNLYWIFVMFGTVHPEWNGEEFIRKASDAARRSGKKCLLVSVGRPGAAGSELLRNLQLETPDWEFLLLGQQSEEDISQCLMQADFGVSAVPPEYLFKSGTAAAMIERGLPIIATRPTYQYLNCPEEVILRSLRNVVTDCNLAAWQKSPVESLLPVVAGQFIENLQGG